MKINFLKTLAGLMLAAWPATAIAAEPIAVNGGNTAWLLVSAALVMLMTPGLAFFYAGMVRRKNVVSTLFKTYAALAVVGVLWAVVGYSIAFGEGSPFFGSFTQYFMLKGVDTNGFVLNGTTYDIPHLGFMVFQMMFAIITPALIIGALVERIDFKAWLVFLGTWSLFIYAPIAHWVWGPNGWIFNDGGLDFAGGLVVHISSGVSALVAALMFGRRLPSDEPPRPNDVSMVMLGAALLWFGWFGFNAGSALAANGLAAHAFVTTFLAAACAFLSWMLYDWIANGKPSAVGGAIGLVVGLVVITPGAGFVSIGHAMLMGFVGGIVCNFVSRAMRRATRLDDALDVFGCHGMGGILGALMTGLFASSAVNSAVVNEGLLVGGEPKLFISNLYGTCAVILFSVVGTFVLLKIIGIFMKIRVSEEAEMSGLDDALHGEYARYREQDKK